MVIYGGKSIERILKKNLRNLNEDSAKSVIGIGVQIWVENNSGKDFCYTVYRRFLNQYNLNYYVRANTVNKKEIIERQVVAVKAEVSKLLDKAYEEIEDKKMLNVFTDIHCKENKLIKTDKIVEGNCFIFDCQSEEFNK